MLSIRTILATLLAFSPVGFASANIKSHYPVSRGSGLLARDDWPPPDVNSTSTCGAIQHVSQGEKISNLTVHFLIPNLHMKPGPIRTQGITFFGAIDLVDCSSSLKMGVNSVFYPNGSQYNELFYQWGDEAAIAEFLNYPLNNGDEMSVEILPLNATLVRLTLINESKTSGQSFEIAALDPKDALCLGNFAVMMRDPSGNQENFPPTDSPIIQDPPTSLAEFSAVQWTFIDCTTADGKQYNVDGAQWIWMTDKEGDRYRVIAFDKPNANHRQVIMEGQPDPDPSSY